MIHQPPRPPLLPSPPPFRSDYPHIQPRRLYRPAELILEAVDVVVPRGLTVAYVPGVSDNVAPVLQQLGVPLTVVEPSALRSEEHTSELQSRQYLVCRLLLDE